MAQTRKKPNKENLKPTTRSSQDEAVAARKTKRKITDPTWTKKSESKGSHQPSGDPLRLIKIRATVKPTITTQSGRKVKPKVSFLMKKTALGKLPAGKSPRTVAIAIQHELKSRVDNYREAGEIISDDKGEAVKVRTPESKTELTLERKMFDGAVSIFRQVSFSPQSAPSPDLEPKTPIKQIERKAEFNRASAVRAVKKNKGKIHKEIIITPELLKQSEIEIRRAKGRRSVSQNKLFTAPGFSEKKVSATRYAQASKEFLEDLKWEWLHFIAHKILASKAQDEKNLGCGTYHCNTEMMFVEYQIPELAAAFPKGFMLKVEPEFVKGTQMLRKIRYTIITDDFTLPFVFNAQMHHKPDYLGYQYTGALVAAMIKLRNGEVKSPDKPADQYPTSHLFYSPRKSPTATAAPTASAARETPTATRGR